MPETGEIKIPNRDLDQYLLDVRAEWAHSGTGAMVRTEFDYNVYSDLLDESRVMHHNAFDEVVDKVMRADRSSIIVAEETVIAAIGNQQRGIMQAAANFDARRPLAHREGYSTQHRLELCDRVFGECLRILMLGTGENTSAWAKILTNQRPFVFQSADQMIDLASENGQLSTRLLEQIIRNPIKMNKIVERCRAKRVGLLCENSKDDTTIQPGTKCQPSEQQEPKLSLPDSLLDMYTRGEHPLILEYFPNLDPGSRVVFNNERMQFFPALVRADDRAKYFGAVDAVIQTAAVDLLQRVEAIYGESTSNVRFGRNLKTVDGLLNPNGIYQLSDFTAEVLPFDDTFIDTYIKDPEIRKHITTDGFLHLKVSACIKISGKPRTETSIGVVVYIRNAADPKKRELQISLRKLNSSNNDAQKRVDGAIQASAISAVLLEQDRICKPFRGGLVKGR